MEKPVKARNTQHNPDPVQSALEKKYMIPGGWNTHYDTGPVELNMAGIPQRIEKHLINYFLNICWA